MKKIMLIAFALISIQAIAQERRGEHRKEMSVTRFNSNERLKIIFRKEVE